jgi:hypothetical protein
MQINIIYKGKKQNSYITVKGSNMSPGSVQNLHLPILMAIKTTVFVYSRLSIF